ncbi:MAG: Hsp33 family molecular chaperone [Rhizobiales bacterium 65-9]|nr:Hsp33 family molecular chaperone [Hyphomicrobiales bacterium]OJY37283.1 MAG: Hsp33 family molecular chaperone [Rhizobiales bacterium 65-9]
MTSDPAVSGDRILPFSVEPLDVRGRVITLGPALDEMLTKHGYPASVSRAVGEAAALTALMGASLKFEGRFQLQARGDGPAGMIVVDFETPDRMRAYARFDAEAVAHYEREGRATPGDLVGRGHLAFTIDQGSEQSRYQGVVALEGQGFEAAAHEYFLRSEQIPTRVRLAVAESIAHDAPNRWRAGGVMVQFLPSSPERQRQRDLDPGDAPSSHARDETPEDDAWVEARSLIETVEDHELIDPTLSSERLLYRLFHERGVRVFPPQSVRHQCRCSRARVFDMLRNFSGEERRQMIADDGQMIVTCEFCSARYRFAPEDFAA